MADDLNFKNSKPTLKTPTDLGKKMDGGFSKEIRKVGLNMKNMAENNLNINEKKESLKKKIFDLAKMETLVYTDEYLSNIYNDLKQDAEETYGYHWNETIMNILFNEYVLNDVGYLQKYKNTRAVEKERRGQEGSEELERKLQNKVDTEKKDDDAKVLQRDKKMSDIKGDTSAVDKVKKELGDHHEEEEGEKDDIAAKMKKASEDADNEINELFGLGKPSVPLNTHKASKNDTYIVDKRSRTAVGVISPNIPQDQNQATAANFADGLKYEKMPWYVAVKNGIKGVPTEVTDGSMADFASDETRFDGIPALGENDNYEVSYNKDAWDKVGDQNSPHAKAADQKLQTSLDNFNKNIGVPPRKIGEPKSSNDQGSVSETTTSASSGAFVGPFPAKRKKVLDTPLWHGGSIIKSSVLKESTSKDYLTNPDGFKKYVNLVESISLLENMVNAPVDEAVSIKQHAEQILRQLQRMAGENPELNELPEYQEIVKIYSDRAATGKVEDQPQAATATVDNTRQFQPPVQEHHLSTREDKLDYIKQHGSDQDIDAAYTAVEKSNGVVEEKADPNYVNGIKTELENTSNVNPANMSTSELESKDGLFKDNGIKEKAESKSQQRFMGMVHAAQKGDLDTSNLKNPEAVEKAADSMSKNDVEDFASTKHAGLPEKVKEDDAQGNDASLGNDNILVELGKHLFPDLNKNDVEIATLAKNFINDFPQLRGRSPKDILNLVKNTTANMAESSMLDDMPDSMVNTPETSMAKTMDSEELNITGVPAEGSQPVTESINKKENMNEERMTPSMLNKEKINKETAALTKKDMANADALKQAEVYPDPKEFYIEQDLDKVQSDAKTAEELEKEALAKIQPKDSGLKNVGDSTNAQGNEIPKRNLTKDEMLALAMNRGDGMHNIVYDNKPSERFEDRLKQDMGEDQYKLRQEKMKYKEDMPMYNKDTQPIENGNPAEQDNKFKKGFNNESFTGKYVDDFGKTKLVEFVVDNVSEVETIDSGYKLNLEGLGNKYTQKIDENKNFANIVNDFDFYLVENNVVKMKKTTESSKQVMNENTLKKMEHLMGYNSRDFVNTKKSVKF